MPEYPAPSDDILIVSGSLQALDLVNSVFLTRGDTVIIEQETYQGALTRLARLGVNAVGIPLDGEGMRIDALAPRSRTWRGAISVRNISTPSRRCRIQPRQSWAKSRRVQLLNLSEQYGVPIFEDDCYADLIWDGTPSAGAVRHVEDRWRDPYRIVFQIDRARLAGRIHRRGLERAVADARDEDRCRLRCARADGTGRVLCAALHEHVPQLRRGLRGKLETLMEALNEQFGTAAEFDDPKGGIFLWVKLPDGVDTLKLYQSALAAGVAINPGPEWSTNPSHSRSRLRLCFASPSKDEIRQGVATLAEVCRKEFGVPTRIANVERAAK